MGLLSWLLRRPQKAEALQSDVAALQSDLERFKSPDKALQSARITEVKYSPQTVLEPLRLSHPVELQRDSLQLGIAAGYTGKALREIESSLSRIESQMTSKDWFSSQFEDKTPHLIEMLDQHEKNSQQRFEAIQSRLDSLKETAGRAPEPFKTQLMEQISSIEMQMPLTPKMKELLDIVKQTGQISYEDLHTRLNIGLSALRGLLSNMVKRTNEIERFDRDGKGWVKYTGK